MYIKVSVEERLPTVGKIVIAIDLDGNAKTLMLTELGWSEETENAPIKYWLDEIVDKKEYIFINNYDSEKIIGDVRLNFENLKHKNFEWKSYYNGWIQGRSNMLFEIIHPFIKTKKDIIKLKYIR